MPLILHGFPLSGYYQIVLIVAAELGLEIIRVEIDPRQGEHKQPQHLAHQPFGQVPYLEDTEAGLELFEGRAICRYLVAKSGSDALMPLASTGNYLARLAKFETAASIEYAAWSPLAMRLINEGLYKKPFGRGDPDPAIMEELCTKLSEKLDGYERILAKQAYLAGDEISLPDLFHFPAGHYLFRAGLGHLIQSKSNVDRWWKSISQRDSCLQVYRQLEVDKVIDNLVNR